MSTLEVSSRQGPLWQGGPSGTDRFSGVHSVRQKFLVVVMIVEVIKGSIVLCDENLEPLAATSSWKLQQQTVRGLP